MNMTFEEFYNERYWDYYSRIAYEMGESFIKDYSEKFQERSNTPRKNQ